MDPVLDSRDEVVDHRRARDEQGGPTGHEGEARGGDVQHGQEDAEVEEP